MPIYTNERTISMNEIYQMHFKSLQEATGEIPYNMTNDYMFRAVLQSNNKVLCGLIRSLLHFDETTFIKGGKEYRTIKPIIHIGFLDYTLFEDSPQFYSTYKLMNTQNYYIYSDNFDLRVVDLTKIELATEDDKQYHIDYWASLFKSKTWEEIKMLADKNEYIHEASESIFKMTADDLVLKRCRDREDYIADIASYQHENAKLAAACEKERIARTQAEKALEQERLAKEKAESEIAILQKKLEAYEAKQ